MLPGFVDVAKHRLVQRGSSSRVGRGMAHSPESAAGQGGLAMIALDPTKSLTSPADAMTVAGALLRLPAVWLGSGINQGCGAGIWEANSEAPLAAMLYAASPRGNGKGIGWVLRVADSLHEANTSLD